VNYYEVKYRNSKTNRIDSIIVESCCEKGARKDAKERIGKDRIIAVVKWAQLKEEEENE
jgi:hypothetical protein